MKCCEYSTRSWAYKPFLDTFFCCIVLQLQRIETNADIYEKVSISKSNQIYSEI